MDIATQMILDLCGGEVSEITDDKSEIKELRTMNYDTNLTYKYGGINIAIKEQIKILEKLGFKSTKIDSLIIEVIIPSFRPDIEGMSDIVEEIIRIYGFENIEPISLKVSKDNSDEVLSASLKSFYKSKRLIANRGYLETVTYSFMDEESANLISEKPSIKIRNPISNDLNTMRPSTFPNLLSSINSNISRLYLSGKFFEVGPNFKGINDNDQVMVATGIQYGLVNESSWNTEKRFADVYDIKGDVLYILEQLNVPVDSLQQELFENKIYHPGKSAQLKLGKNIIANFGEIHPLILKRYDLKTSVLGFEIFLETLEQFQVKKSSTKKAYDNNPFQLVERDFAFLFPISVKGNDIIKKIKKIDKSTIKNVIIFDIFEGSKLPENKKSIAIKVVLQPQDKTFTEEQIENLSINIIDLIFKSFEGELRQ